MGEDLDPHHLLKKYQVKAKKYLSQNFLTDLRVLASILDFAKVRKTDSVLEIGPGLGALTHALLSTGCHVTAIEIDRDLYQILQKEYVDPRLRLYNADILEKPLHTYFDKPFKVVANIPYQITSPILGALAESRDSIISATLMVQKEIALRICADKKSTHNSALSIFCQTYFSVNLDRIVSKEAFSPQPKVDSALVTLIPREPGPEVSVDFFPFVRACFQKRRKMLKSTHKEHQIIAHLESMGCNPLSRPQDLSAKEFMTLFNLIQEESEDR